MRMVNYGVRKDNIPFRKAVIPDDRLSERGVIPPLSWQTARNHRLCFFGLTPSGVVE